MLVVFDKKIKRWLGAYKCPIFFQKMTKRNGRTVRIPLLFVSSSFDVRFVYTLKAYFGIISYIHVPLVFVSPSFRVRS